MNIISRILWAGTCALRWIEKVTCNHPSPVWEGDGLTMMGHREAVPVSYWHCLKCGKHFEKVGGGEKATRLENLFFEGAEAYMLGGSLFDNPFKADSASGDAWHRGFMNEARRRPRDPK